MSIVPTNLVILALMLSRGFKCDPLDFPGQIDCQSLYPAGKATIKKAANLFSRFAAFSLVSKQGVGLIRQNQKKKA